MISFNLSYGYLVRFVDQLAGEATLGAILALQAVAQWAVGDASLFELLNRLPEILGGLGLMALRAGIAAAGPAAQANLSADAPGKAESEG